MVYEIAVLPIHDGKIEMFGRAFANVTPLLRRAKGYEGHLLTQGAETPEQFTLIVKWAKLEDHTPGFEASSDHDKFMEAIQEYISGETVVYHVHAVPDIEEAGMDDNDECNGIFGF